MIDRRYVRTMAAAMLVAGAGAHGGQLDQAPVGVTPAEDAQLREFVSDWLAFIRVGDFPRLRRFFPTEQFDREQLQLERALRKAPNSIRQRTANGFALCASFRANDAKGTFDLACFASQKCPSARELADARTWPTWSTAGSAFCVRVDRMDDRFAVNVEQFE